MGNSWHIELRQLYNKCLAQKMHKISARDPYRPEDQSTVCLAVFASSSTICCVSWGQMWQLLGAQLCFFTNNLGLVWGSCLNPEDVWHTFQSEGMGYGFGESCSPVLLMNNSHRSSELSCARDQAQLRLPHPCLVQFHAHFWEQSSCTEHDSTWALRCCVISDLSLAKSILMSFPRGSSWSQLLYLQLVVLLSLTSVLWQNPSMMQDGAGVEIN